MSIHDPRDTLAYHNSRVATVYRDMRDTPTHKVAAKIKAFMANDLNKNCSPDAEAISFYAMNHGMALIAQHYAPLEPLAKEDLEFVEAYHAMLVPMAVRAFYYLTLICTREGRHNKNWPKTTGYVKETYGPTLGLWFEKAGASEDGIANSLLNAPPAAKFGDYCHAFQWAFYNSSWSGGYGGPAWGAVNDCLCRFVDGEFSAEMMLDTNWTLAHNNGPIFNKGQMYGHYSALLYRVLDVQRSGQVPEAVLFDPQIMKATPPEITERMIWLKTRFSDKLGLYVDWYQVMNLGALHGPYVSEKAAQVKQFGIPAHAAEAEKAALLKQQQAEMAAKTAAAEAEMQKALEKAEFEATHFEYMPGKHVKKVQVRKQAA